MTAHAIRFPEFHVFRLSAFPPFPQSSSSFLIKIFNQVKSVSVPSE